VSYLKWINRYKNKKNQDDSQKNPPTRKTGKGDRKVKILTPPRTSVIKGTGKEGFVVNKLRSYKVQAKG
jgi:hypothetical protein